MNTLAAIRKRRSRRKYEDEHVPLDLIGAVIEAGTMAPSAGNQQSWKFVVVQDEEKRKQLAEACLNQNWMSKAPVHIVVVSEEAKMSKLYGIRGEKLYSIQTCAAAVENMLLAAEELGLGACWVSAFEEGIVSRICEIPETARPQAIITLGFPKENPMNKIIQPLERVMYIERYDNRMGDLSSYMWDWSGVAENEIKGMKSGFGEMFKKHLEAHRKKLKQKWSVIQKKIDEKIRRPLN